MVDDAKYIVEDFDAFIHSIQRLDPNARIEKAFGDTTIVPEFQKSVDQGALVRAPKFMVVTQNGHYSLAIIDENTRVDLKAIGLSYQHKVRAATADDGLLKRRGFSSFKHPMFLNEDGFIERVYIDANIAMQAELYPESQIILPAMKDGQEVKVSCRIDAFMSVMQERFGEDNVINANVARKRWQADVLRQHILKDPNVSTRFAPSPTGSLHFGSLRSALVPYLLALSKGGDFTLRFDDTNQEKSQEHFVHAIIDDLAWIGLKIESSQMFRQSDAERLPRYEEILEKLVAAGFTDVKDGKIVLKRHVEGLSDIHWMDWHRGPQYIHRLQAPKPREGRYGNLVLADVGDNLLRYKIIGALHDPMFTHVFRDFEQEYLTQSQSYISGLMRMVGVDEVSGVPPVYGHVPLVAKGKDENGKPLKYSKSTNAPEEGIQYVRENNVFLPESILCGVLMTIIPNDVQREEGFRPEDIYDHCAEHGLHAVLEHVAQRFTLDWVDHGVTKQYVHFSKDQIPKIERHILRAMPFERFKDAVDASSFDVDQSTVEKLYNYREDFAGWEELSLFLDRWYGEQSKQRCINTSQGTPDWRAMRQVLLGKEDGPALEVLLSCIPQNGFFVGPRPEAYMTLG